MIHNHLRHGLSVLLLFLCCTCSISLWAQGTPTFSSKNYYRIISAKTGARAVDIDGEKSYEGEKICIWNNLEGRTTEDWIIHQVGEYIQILSRNGGWAIADPTEGECTPTTNTGATLQLAAADETKDNQLWQLVAQGNDRYNIINKHTQHTMNVNGGNDANGTMLISYKSEPDGKDKTSTNRMWRFVEGAEITGTSGSDVEIDDTPDDIEEKLLSNLPHLYIYTNNSQKIDSKKTFVKCKMTFIDAQNQKTVYENLSIRGRGNSTWNRTPNKKPYRLRFDEAVELLGPDHAKARNWTLMANAYDKTLMRNALTNELSEFCGLPFNPAYEFVDVTLNGEYIGTYHISDHIEVGEKRVDIPLGGTGTDVSYFLEVDGYAEHNWFSASKTGTKIRIHYPKDGVTSAQNTYIKNYVNSFEAALFGDDFRDPEKGYRAMIDSVTLANWYIADEVCGNLDGFWSLYFYKKQGDPRLYMGPMWDYDIAYANDSRRGDTSRMLMVDQAFELDHAGRWVKRMWEDPWFQQLINRRYKELVDAGLQSFLIQKVDSMATLLNESQALNYKKYGIRTQEYNERVLHDTYAEYVADLRAYIRLHVIYLQKAFANKLTVDPNTAIPSLETIKAPKNGEYMQDGKIVIVKDGKKYNVLGQEIN